MKEEESGAYNNKIALDKNRKPIEIKDAKSGKRGYYCRGCGGELVAKKGKIEHHFAHYAIDVNIERECTYSNEKYRHKIAQEILQRIKQIKVPALYKVSPNNENRFQKIRGPQTVYASEVRNKLSFYENDDGEIRYGKLTDAEQSDKNILSEPDVTFFDENHRPILLIDLVGTHKINVDRLSKIKRLGIDTIQINIPKDSPENIEFAFYRTQRTKWIYNYERETTTYDTKRAGQELPSINEFERLFLKTEKSFECRSAEITRVIRGIKNYLGSEQYKRAERELREEFTRVEENAERVRDELQRVQKEYKEGINNEIQEQFREEESGLEEETNSFKKEKDSLEKKYEQYKEKKQYENRQIQIAETGIRKAINSGKSILKSKGEASYKEELQEEHRGTITGIEDTSEGTEYSISEINEELESIETRRKEIRREEAEVEEDRIRVQESIRKILSSLRKKEKAKYQERLQKEFIHSNRVIKAGKYKAQKCTNRFNEKLRQVQRIEARISDSREELQQAINNRRNRIKEIEERRRTSEARIQKEIKLAGDRSYTEVNRFYKCSKAIEYKESTLERLDEEIKQVSGYLYETWEGITKRVEGYTDESIAIKLQEFTKVIGISVDEYRKAEAGVESIL